MIIQQWAAKLALLAGLAALLMFAVSGPGHRFGLWSYMTGFDLMKYAVFAGGAAAVLGLLALIIRLGFAKEGAIGGALVGLIIGGVVAGFIFNMVMTLRAQNFPMMHDITTDFVDVPTFDQIARIRDGLEGVNTLDYEGKSIKYNDEERLVSDIQKEVYPNVQPLILDKPAGEVWAAALGLAKARGWEIVAANEINRTIEATETTFFFGFKDDVVIRLSTVEDGNTRVDMRSISRVGMSDIGVNAARIEKFLSDLASQMG